MLVCVLILLMPTDCDVNPKSEPIWVLLIQSAPQIRFSLILLPRNYAKLFQGGDSFSHFKISEKKHNNQKLQSIGHQNHESYDHFRVDDIVFTGIFQYFQTSIWLLFEKPFGLFFHCPYYIPSQLLSINCRQPILQ